MYDTTRSSGSRRSSSVSLSVSMCVVCAWCRSFTNTERTLLVVQAVLLVLAGVLLLLLVLHLVACRDRLFTSPAAFSSSTTAAAVSPTTTGRSTLDIPANSTRTTANDIECTWEPSVHTEAGERHYLRPEALSGRPSGALPGGLLLVEGGLRCAGAAVSSTWAVTAGDCARRATKAGGRRVIETRLHPIVPLALLRTGSAPEGHQPVVLPFALPSALQAALVGPGERLTVLGYYFRDGLFEARSESVWSLPRRECSSPTRRGLRHISPLGALSGAGCPRAPLCAGVAPWAGRGAGLLRGKQLLAIQTDTNSSFTGAVTYTSLAAVKNWILQVIST